MNFVNKLKSWIKESWFEIVIVLVIAAAPSYLISTGILDVKKHSGVTRYGGTFWMTPHTTVVKETPKFENEVHLQWHEFTNAFYMDPIAVWIRPSNPVYYTKFGNVYFVHAMQRYESGIPKWANVRSVEHNDNNAVTLESVVNWRSYGNVIVPGIFLGAMLGFGIAIVLCIIILILNGAYLILAGTWKSLRKNKPA